MMLSLLKLRSLSVVCDRQSPLIPFLCDDIFFTKKVHLVPRVNEAYFDILRPE